jgi:hypothetical protein
MAFGIMVDGGVEVGQDSGALQTFKRSPPTPSAPDGHIGHPALVINPIIGSDEVWDCVRTVNPHSLVKAVEGRLPLS